MTTTTSDTPKPEGVIVPSKRTIANRQNAQKSTGPRTPRGKSSSKRNATTHGLLSNEIYLAHHNNPEALNQFRVTLADLQKTFAPSTPLEAMLVERMAVAWWRLGRVLAFELREARRAVKVASMQLPERAQEPANYDLLFDLLREDPEYTANLLGKALEILQYCLKEATEKGYLNEFCLNELKSVPGGIFTRCLSLLSLSESDKQPLVIVTYGPEGPAPAGSAENKAAQLLAEEWTNLLRWSDICAFVRRVPELQAALRRPDLPSKEVIDRILRYETSIERQFYRAMDQLEHLQRRRQGEFVSAPVNVHLDVEQ